MADIADRSNDIEHEVSSQADLPRFVLDNLLEGCQVIGLDYRYLYVNNTVVKHGRATRAQLLGRTMMEAYPGIENTRMFTTLQRCMEERSPAEMENEFTFPDGSKGWFELRFQPVPDGVVILSVDITTRKHAEDEIRQAHLRLRASAERWRRTFDAISDSVCVISTDFDIVEANRAASQWFRLSRGQTAASLKCFEIIHGTQTPVANCPCVTVSKDGKPATVVIEEKDKTLRMSAWPLEDADGQLEGFVHIVEDITAEVLADKERTQLREQLVVSQKLEAIGRLAGGVAHDFNNLLLVIGARADLAIAKLPKSDSIRSQLEAIRDAGLRAEDLTRQLLAFGRRQVLQPKLLNLNKVVGEIEGVLQPLLGANIDLVTDLADDLGNVLADSGQIDQVIMNLVINARDAMPDGGTLLIATNNIDVDDEGENGPLTKKPRSFVRLSITDTGHGMTADVRERAFEPFFTTKDKTKGSGLGLSTAYGIVEQSGGHIEIESEPESGSTFHVYLPLGAEPAAETERVPLPSISNGKETVLVVEDSPAVRDLTKHILQEAGYRVLSAASGPKALLLVETYGDQIDLLLTDIVMPNMSGWELAERMSQKFPTIRTLYMSGYADSVAENNRTNFIGKPFRAAELMRRVRDAIGNNQD